MLTGESPPTSEATSGEIGRYRVEREIGRGGMAVVYLARQLDLDRPVALKKLAGLHASDPTVTTRFVREARLAGSLNHPNIVTVYEYFEHAGLPYIAMEFLPRGPLRPLVGALTVPQVVGVLNGVLAGLTDAEEHRIVHRDLKPENVMRTDDGGIKIADFGIAKAYDELATANLTPAGEFVGAPAYVSPEQVLGSPATGASDLYSVGVIAFELLTGAVPFAGEGSASALLVRKVNERPPTLRSQRPEIDRALTDWVDRLLERDPSKRPASAQAVRESLEDAADHALGVRWRRVAALPSARPERSPVPFLAPVPHRFVAVRTLRTRAPCRLLTANALRSPTNLLAGAAIAIAAALLTPWLFAVAAVAYVAMAAITFFDECEAARVASQSKRPAFHDH
jgi:serine/threonine protein kinase